jgi:hypothetical protein
MQDSVKFLCQQLWRLSVKTYHYAKGRVTAFGDPALVAWPSVRHMARTVLVKEFHAAEVNRNIGPFPCIFLSCTPTWPLTRGAVSMQCPLLAEYELVFQAEIGVYLSPLPSIGK